MKKFSRTNNNTDPLDELVTTLRHEATLFWDTIAPTLISNFCPTTYAKNMFCYHAGILKLHREVVIDVVLDLLSSDTRKKVNDINPRLPELIIRNAFPDTWYS